MPQPTINNVHVNRPLTNISIAYIQDQMNFIASRVFPNIPVDKQSDLYFKYLKGDWLRSEAQERAPGTESAGSGWKLSNESYFSRVYAVHKDIDDQIRANADAPLNMDRDATEWVTHQLLIKREKIWMSKYFGAVWDTNLTGVGSNPTSGQFLQWDQTNATPIKDVTDSAIAVAELTGYKPNTLVVDPYTFNALRNAPDVLDRIKYTQRGVVTADLLASIFEVDNFFVAMAIENSAVEGATDDISFIANKGALLCYSNPQPSILKPSAGYTFSWNGYLGAGVAGNRIKKFRMEQLESDRVEGTIAFDSKQVASDLGVWFGSTVS